ncbi:MULTISPECIES: hypothetical protein [unclassified Paenibacillus]|uniref:hypothetical protein n=1 Tax=unclassified Paenibacillus TaxID=185978 RepID=UPI000954C331|nr:MULTISPECIES: hypothetical protein [unclassified Paenibacillus]ASS68488.1 hypothetical protein CIC07_21885 [Paenibacillus sp. RUD330]SIR35132.1 hypothetical protein SAMN05880555_3564 [Paenibacillus sp. RU4X]SIR45861.1 hypothetical protein SAMN05880570_3565 [Paenibacillus sp. RU4T]
MKAWKRKSTAGKRRIPPAAASLLLLAVVAVAGAAAAPFRLDKDVVGDTTVVSASQLAKQADCIAVGRFSDSDRMVLTDRTAPQGRLVNFVQPFTVERMLKCPSSSSVRIITTGIEPLPPPSQTEANERYPGAWASGPDYLVFLQKLEGQDGYQVLGLLKGVYPIQAGKTVSLERQGFPELNGVSKENLDSVVKGLEGR